MVPISRMFLPAMLLLVVSACASRGESLSPPVKGAVLDHIHMDHHSRSYWLYAPAGHDKPRPLLVVLHETGSNGAAMIRLGNFAAMARAADFVLAAPNAEHGAFNAGAGQAWPRNEKADDVAFISAMIDKIRHEYRISRVFAVGFSSGGAMALRLALAIPDQLEGVASVAGQLQPPSYTQRSKPLRPVPMLLLFGDEDPLEPVHGGPVHYGPNRIVDTPAPDATASHWASYYGCSTSIAATAKIIRQTGWYSCKDNVTVMLLSIEGLGHHWPGGNPSDEASVPGGNAGPDLGNVRATDIVWNFFKRIPPRKREASP